MVTKTQDTQRTEQEHLKKIAAKRIEMAEDTTKMEKEYVDMMLQRRKHQKAQQMAVMAHTLSPFS